MILFKEAMSVIGMSYERTGHMHMEDLRREAFVEAQIRRARGRAGSRIAVALRAVASRFDASERLTSGPWREDFHYRTAKRA